MTAENAALTGFLNQLAYYWQRIDETTQWYFEQFYVAMPEYVSQTLCGTPLPRDDEHPSLAAWVATLLAQQDVIGNVGPELRLGEVTVQPANPAPGESFAVGWTGAAMTDFPPRQDQVTIYDTLGGEVAEQAVLHLKTAAGSIAAQVTFGDGLPIGTYTVRVIANSNGSDGTYLDTEQGEQSQVDRLLYVGDTRESQLAEDNPKWAAAIGAVQATSIGSFEDARQKLVSAANQLASMDQLGPGFASDLGQIATQLQRWWGTTDEQWIPVRDQLLGASATASQDDAGTFAVRFMQIMDELFNPED